VAGTVSDDGTTWTLDVTGVTGDWPVLANFAQLSVLDVPATQQVVAPGGRYELLGVPAQAAAGATIAYSQRGAAVTAPDALGLYDVTVTRPQDQTYRAVDVVIPDGLKVTAVDPLAPAFTAGLPPAVTAPAGGTLTLSVQVSNTGQGTLSYRWIKDGADVGQNSPAYTKSGVTALDAGAYEVVVTRNVAGTNHVATARTTVTVGAAAPAPAALTEAVLASARAAVAGKALYVVKGKTVKVPVVAYGSEATVAGVAAGTVSSKLSAAWKSSKAKVATLTSSGAKKAKAGKGTLAFVVSKAATLKVKGVKPGKATITVKAGGKTLRLKVVVVKKPVKAKAVKVSGSKSLKRGQAKFYRATVKPSKATGGIVRWKVSSKKVASVDACGRLVAKKKGKVTLTATVGSRKVSKKITVK
jgi:hypothetical protein